MGPSTRKRATEMLTEDAFLGFIGAAKRTVCEVWETDPMVPPLCRIYIEDGPDTGVPFPIDEIPGEAHWPILTAVCRQLDAYAIMQIREVWLAVEDVPEDLSREEVKKLVRSNPVRPSEREDRKEAVMIAWEYQRRCGVSQCMITRDAHGKGTLSEWTDHDDVEGRMVRLLPGKGEGN
jgi:hypothetical protein